MIEKWKIFAYKIEWYDIKTKTKKIIRSLFYSALAQNLICRLIVGYMWFVYISSKRKFINCEAYLEAAKQQHPVIIASWHNRLMMMPFIARFAIKKANKNYRFITLASRHGDGQFVGRVMEAFGFYNIYGSSQNGRKKSRGINLHSLREIVRGLKEGKAFGITPDGPRGPNQKINSEIIGMAKISGAAIMPASYSCSRFIQFKSWDQFKLPLPFATICFYCSDFIFVDREITKEVEALLKIKLEKELNLAQEKSFELCS